jgi:hypothetical protein
VRAKSASWLFCSARIPAYTLNFFILELKFKYSALMFFGEFKIVASGDFVWE